MALSTSTATNNPFPIETAITVSILAALVILFALAFKKNYVTIEIVDEEEPESLEAYSIVGLAC